jgi:hypothetical protein
MVIITFLRTCLLGLTQVKMFFFSKTISNNLLVNFLSIKITWVSIVQLGLGFGN